MAGAAVPVSEAQLQGGDLLFVAQEEASLRDGRPSDAAGPREDDETALLPVALRAQLGEGEGALVFGGDELAVGEPQS